MPTAAAALREALLEGGPLQPVHSGHHGTGGDGPGVCVDSIPVSLVTDGWQLRAGTAEDHGSVAPCVEKTSGTASTRLELLAQMTSSSRAIRERWSSMRVFNLTSSSSRKMQLRESLASAFAWPSVEEVVVPLKFPTFSSSNDSFA